MPTEDGWRLLGYNDGLPDDSVSDLAIDARGQLWLAIYGEGAYRVEAARVRSLAQTRQRPVIDDAVQIHADACAAAQALGRPSESGQIAREDSDTAWTVFFDRRQVCPATPGYRAAAGAWGTVRDGGVWLYEAGPVRTLALPPGLADSMVTALHRDDTGRWWLGSRHLGVFEQQGDGWRAHGREAGLAANPVQAIDRDARGRLWVATYPGVTRGGGESRAGLHRFDGTTWRAIVPSTSGRQLFQHPNQGQYRDLASRDSNDVRVLADGRVAVATNAGLTLLRSPEDMESFDRYNLGLPSNYVQSISQDDEGRLWFTHAYWGEGVSWKAGPIFRNRNTRDGLFADRLVAAAHDAQQRVWLQASDGRLAIYDRERLMR